MKIGPARSLRTATILWALGALAAPGIARAQGGSVLPAGSLDTPFVYGPVALAPGLSYGYNYNMGIEYTPGHTTDSSMQVVTPNIAGTVGSVWSFGYDPSWTFYSSSRFHNSVDQRGEIAAAWVTDDWNLRVDQQVSALSQPLLETGEQTRQNIYTTTLSGSRQIGSALTFTTTESQQIESAGVTFSHGQTWSTDDSWLYQFAGTLSGGPGITCSYMRLEGDAELLESSPTVRLNWQINEISSFTAFAGFENQTFLKGHFRDSNAPSFGASINFISQFGTTITGSASDTASFSQLTAQRTQAQTAQLTVHQTVLEHGFLEASGNVGHIDYTVASNVSGGNRSDNVYGGTLSLGITGFLRHGSIRATYTYTHDSSTLSGFTESPKTLGLSVSYRY